MEMWFMSSVQIGKITQKIKSINLTLEMDKPYDM